MYGFLQISDLDCNIAEMIYFNKILLTISTGREVASDNHIIADSIEGCTHC
jgi:hypothetical protein